VFCRDTGRLVWSLACDRPNLKSPTIFDLHLDEDIDADVENESEVKGSTMRRSAGSTKQG
jgi:hypothetical protein